MLASVVGVETHRILPWGSSPRVFSHFTRRTGRLHRSQRPPSILPTLRKHNLPTTAMVRLFLIYAAARREAPAPAEETAAARSEARLDNKKQRRWSIGPAGDTILRLDYPWVLPYVEASFAVYEWDHRV